MKVITVGDNCIDYYVGDNIGYPGGNPVNVGVYFKRYDADCSYIGAIGDDEFGKLIVNALKSKDIDVSKVKVLEGSTARTDVYIKNGNREFGDYDEGVLSQFKLDNKDIEYINTFDLMVSGLWSKVENDLKYIHIPIAFDFADKWDSEIWDKALPYIDFVFYSDDVHTIEDIKNNMKKIYRENHKVIVCTRGEYGSIAYDGYKFYEQGIVECEVIDTMGAGDSFIAGFLYEYYNNNDVEKALKEGAKNSAVTIGYKGAWSYEY